ncbi:hypothetical protein [Paractinoplanes brasiliensis]|uniref:Excalibur calcium-binding domain-containing protein n=1 Tax=Paractinoplanes brasiliensis TaxID=52695 RepID=A0A4R6J9I2_9ACTN|nr:hypothetical protein [Actinoplanes brasiliensis]TDO32142.1 hypothetical protein C8E87_7587 [Actinoplanes brasiliensis]GID28195.1 hypothetical protein Abr02nite_31780 [Actinoplanes brasiliensis]
MTPRRLVLFTAVAVAASAAVMIALLLRPAPAAVTPVKAAPPLTRPVPTPAPSVEAALPPEGVVVAATTAIPSAAPASTAATPAAPAPAPFVQSFAAQPGVKPLPALPSPTAPLKVPANVDGCDRGYGTRTQCVPWTFPSSATDKCAWLAAQGFTHLTVHGTDRHQLDPDKNGTACD